MVAKASPRAGVWEDVWLPTTCDMCFNHCNIRVRRVDGVAVKIEGLPGAPPNLGKTCAKGNSGLMNLYSPHRIKSPLIRTNPHKGIGVDPGWRRSSCSLIRSRRLASVIRGPSAWQVSILRPAASLPPGWGLSEAPI